MELLVKILSFIFWWTIISILCTAAVMPLFWNRNEEDDEEDAE